MKKVLDLAIKYRHYVYIALAVAVIGFMFLPTLGITLEALFGTEETITLGIFGKTDTASFYITYGDFAALPGIETNLITVLYWLVTLVFPVAIIAVSTVALCLKKDFLAFDIAVVSLFALQVIALFAVFAPVAQTGFVAKLKDDMDYSTLEGAYKDAADAIINAIKVVPAVGTIVSGCIAGFATLLSGGALTYRLVGKKA